MREVAGVETGVVTRREPQQVGRLELAAGRDGVDVDEVAGQGAGEQRAHLVGHGVLDVENRADAESHRRVGPPVDT